MTTTSWFLLLTLALIALLGLATAVATCVSRDCRSPWRPPPRSRQPLNASGWSNW